MYKIEWTCECEKNQTFVCSCSDALSCSLLLPDSVLASSSWLDELDELVSLSVVSSADSSSMASTPCIRPFIKSMFSLSASNTAPTHFRLDSRRARKSPPSTSSSFTFLLLGPSSSNCFTNFTNCLSTLHLDTARVTICTHLMLPSMADSLMSKLGAHSSPNLSAPKSK
ncbi:hypothetical protein BpHYR1_034252 [Brachionus plicatilis]|uniref:Uncharacterized protein n=1 Tax=Brachionus plicatilis TaxID=10195 RepID=A0A3M7RAQ0_BRAPC|nr:hypothetical protein BpHYR1_034252 [Brachionus plicatilis]